jgi:hypothetical protein
VISLLEEIHTQLFVEATEGELRQVPHEGLKVFLDAKINALSNVELLSRADRVLQESTNQIINCT